MKGNRFARATRRALVAQREQLAELAADRFDAEHRFETEQREPFHPHPLPYRKRMRPVTARLTNEEHRDFAMLAFKRQKAPCALAGELLRAFIKEKVEG